MYRKKDIKITEQKKCSKKQAQELQEKRENANIQHENRVMKKIRTKQNNNSKSMQENGKRGEKK